MAHDCHYSVICSDMLASQSTRKDSDYFCDGFKSAIGVASTQLRSGSFACVLLPLVLLGIIHASEGLVSAVPMLRQSHVKPHPVYKSAMSPSSFGYHSARSHMQCMISTRFRTPALATCHTILYPAAAPLLHPATLITHPHLPASSYALSHLLAHGPSWECRQRLTYTARQLLVHHKYKAGALRLVRIRMSRSILALHEHGNEL
ncbi:uncharacterized protein EDB91DRAFT_235535 [Suillus paluster]|uniref:uncharacterized protein n=1 Tax=Suillus paluster TaxID=48578 RepID=UPI001B87EF34|nr:uncharacterized protein EDB91DRAFT_235535 [Suillus paluster]KAG1743222.1 hypothetical protein EDB91DRAFT_235535 [Suillus paluster]